MTRRTHVLVWNKDRILLYSLKIVTSSDIANADWTSGKIWVKSTGVKVKTWNLPFLFSL